MEGTTTTWKQVHKDCHDVPIIPNVSIHKVIRENSRAVHYAQDSTTKTLCGTKLIGIWDWTLSDVTCPRCKKIGG